MTNKYIPSPGEVVWDDRHMVQADGYCLSCKGPHIMRTFRWNQASADGPLADKDLLRTPSHYEIAYVQRAITRVLFELIEIEESRR